MNKLLLAFTLLMLALSGFAASSIEVFEFEDELQESRYRELIAELRCPKCLNTNLAGSDAAISVDLRKTVHRLLVEGKSNAEILAFLQERYGNFVLYDPPLIPSTWILWFAPLLFVILGGIGLYRFALSQQNKSEQINSEHDEDPEKLSALIEDVLKDESL